MQRNSKRKIRCYRELLQEMFFQISHNVYCYSEDTGMTKPKKEYEKEWYEEKEKLELIEELIQEEKESPFKVHSTMSKLCQGKDIKYNVQLAFLTDKDKGIGCYLEANKKDWKNNIKYMLVFSIHKKDNFYYEYENVYSKDISKETLKNRTTLRKEMEKELDIFKNFIEADKKGKRLFNKYYETKESNS